MASRRSFSERTASGFDCSSVSSSGLTSMAEANAASMLSTALRIHSPGSPTRALTATSKVMSGMEQRPAFSASRRSRKKRNSDAGSRVPAGRVPWDSLLSESLTMPSTFIESIATIMLSRLAPGSRAAVSRRTLHEESVSLQSHAAVPQSLTAMEQNSGS